GLGLRHGAGRGLVLRRRARLPAEAIARTTAPEPGCVMQRFCAITGCAALVFVSACSPGSRPAEGSAASMTAPAAGRASPAGTRAITAGAPEPSASPGAATAAASVIITAVGGLVLRNNPGLPPGPPPYFPAG